MRIHVQPFLLSLIVVAQVSYPQGCRTAPAPAPSTPNSAWDQLPVTNAFTTADGIALGVQTLVTNADIPWSLAFAPDGRLFFTERNGRVRVIVNGELAPAPALTLDDVYLSGESGLLGIALHPSFSTNRLVYLLYSANTPNGPRNRLARYREVNNQFGERAVLMEGMLAANNHDGGRIRFGPDGKLYLTMGDAGIAADAQSLSSLNGKILRVNDDGTTAPGNPFNSPIWTWGHRNPQGIDWNPLNGQMWEAEHGNSGNDEVNQLTAGRNYGWPTIEGSGTRPDMEVPTVLFASGIAPSGLSFYAGTRIPSLSGSFFVTALRTMHIHRFKLDPADPRRVASSESWLQDSFGRIRDVVAGPDGYIYFCTSNRDGRTTPAATDDRIARIVPR
jgi:glucose/arabinose dehydrogenase